MTARFGARNMVEADRYPRQLEEALNQGVLKRLPLTFLPFVNQQLHQWSYLFPNERQSVERLLLYVAHLNAEQSSALFRDVVELEKRMGVRQWQFSTTEQTIQNSSQLARSPYFQEWRRAVQAVFDAADRNARGSNGNAENPAHRLVLLDIPKSLPLNTATAWRRWQGMGKPIQLDLSAAEAKASPLQLLLAGTPAAGAQFVSRESCRRRAAGRLQPMRIPG